MACLKQSESVSQRRGPEGAAGSSSLLRGGRGSCTNHFCSRPRGSRGAGRWRFWLSRRVPAEVFLLWDSKRRLQSRQESPLVLEEREAEKDFHRLELVRGAGLATSSGAVPWGASRTGKGAP